MMAEKPIGVDDPDTRVRGQCGIGRIWEPGGGWEGGGHLAVSRGSM